MKRIKYVFPNQKNTKQGKNANTITISEGMIEKTADTTTREIECDYSIYVDGSFMNQRVKYGAVIIKQNEIRVFKSWRSERKNLSSRNVVGELEAVKMSLQWLQQKKIKEVAIFYDYEGISCKWVTGEWKANLPLTQQYAQEVRNQN